MTHRQAMVAGVALAGALDFAANYLAAHYLVPVGPYLVPGGTFLFALSFSVYDYLRRWHGWRPTVAAIALGFVASILYSALFGGGVGRIALAGVIALACSGSTDLLMQRLTLHWPIWRYVAASNAVSLLVDTLVFTSIAFAALPLAVRLTIGEGQYGVKIMMMALSIPLVYAARAWVASRYAVAESAGCIS